MLFRSLEINEIKLEKVRNYKYLGITLDENMTFGSHIALLNRTVRHKTFLLRKVRPFLTTYAALQVLKVMIAPLLEYGAVIYDSAATKHTHKLQVSLNAAIRAVYKLPRLTPTAVLLDKAKMDPLTTRRHRSILIHAYHKSKIDRHIDKRQIHTRTHAAPVLIVPNGKSKLAHSSLSYSSARSWNALPAQVRTAETITSFKTKLKRQLNLKGK